MAGATIETGRWLHFWAMKTYENAMKTFHDKMKAREKNKV